jgi:hypothetical protein
VTVRYYSESFFLFSVLSPSLPKKKTNVGEMSSQNSSLITPYASSSCNNRLLQIADIKALEEENTNTKTNKQATQGVMALAASYVPLYTLCIHTY